jgi:acyl-CoA synthetase (NDP forming)
MITSPLGDRLAVVSGPGALAVGAAEACGNEDLRLARLSGETKSGLARFVPPTGTSLRNPVDVGLTAAINVDIYARCAEILSRDRGVDSILMVGTGLTPKQSETFTETMIRVSGEISKPLIMVDIPGFDQVFAQKFRQAGIPFFDSSERALSTYAKIRNYQLWRRRRTT